MVSKLQLLDLSTNSLNGTLPLSLANLTQVSELDLSRNDITGILDGSLFPSESSTEPKTGLLSLRYLLFQDTLLGGKIPKEIGNLKFLVSLVLDRSHFNGPIPPSLGNLSHLQALRLSENQLSGKVPETLVNLRNLTDLRLFTNKLSGVVPKELGNFSSFTVLHLGLVMNLAISCLSANPHARPTMRSVSKEFEELELLPEAQKHIHQNFE
ncbi:hypothetical protein FEM48_Zijuj10G0071700 [Ziziphus jujuba var. spinosa]|uniref:non-specific serine/threonine protein kinase n=1 Tax=Ziziphus jujuba var. spinosa TaxID=714518 RepID=A0A978UM12_ZIZJJ|nr:hypothetical protein FEM48_Zijuj10G0071700 [Ziziphus jujuba var. spinosa]